MTELLTAPDINELDIKIYFTGNLSVFAYLLKNHLSEMFDNLSPVAIENSQRFIKLSSAGKESLFKAQSIKNEMTSLKKRQEICSRENSKPKFNNTLLKSLMTNAIRLLNLFMSLNPTMGMECPQVLFQLLGGRERGFKN